MAEKEEEEEETRSNGNEMVRAELLFIPAPAIGHLVSTVEIAKLLIERDERLSATILIMTLPFQYSSTIDTTTLAGQQSRIRFVDLPCDHTGSETQPKSFQFNHFIQSHKHHVKDVVAELARSESGQDSSRKLAGFVVDMFCMTMMDVANEFGLPTYVFFTSSAAYLGLLLHLRSLHDEHGVDITKFKDSDTELDVPTFANPVPSKVLPSVVFDKDGGGSADFLYRGKRLREVKGIMVNTFMELESHAIKSLSFGTTTNSTPRLYPVGPILNLNGAGASQRKEEEEILKWLDDQPPLSVVFLCFGSMGSFGPVQVREIAHGLESSGFHFLWSLRQPPPTSKIPFPTDYSNPQDVLPDGFLERTSGLGKIIGWAPQSKVLAHQAIGGFVSHCGWNSILESLWFGVPVATWPMYAEQQMNAFEMVMELGLAAEIKLDYRKDLWKNSLDVDVVGAHDIERGIRCLMEHKCEVREKVEEMREKSKKSMMVGGSSYVSLGRFIEDVIHNAP